MKKYEPIDHTADMGIRVWGKTKRELFENAAEGMFSLIADKKTVEEKKRIKFSLNAPDLRELFISWLRELLYRYSAKGLVFRKFMIKKLEDTKIVAEAIGEKFSLKKHGFKNDLKAVTYHDLDIKKTKSGWQAQVIFDV